MSRSVRAWIPAAAYMLLIWILSSGTHDISFDQLPFKDKAVHFCEYGLLGLLLAHAVVRTWPLLPMWRSLLTAVSLTVAWGFFDELHQAFVPGRTCDAKDLLADTIGAIAGALSFALLQRLSRRWIAS